MNDLVGETGAIFSPCRKWRYRLWRTWDTLLPSIVFCMMNPSTADEIVNDATIERQVRRVMKWNETGGIYLGPSKPDDPLGHKRHVFGRVEIVNVCALRETDSRQLKVHARKGIDIVGPENDRHILEAAKQARMIVCGWGLPVRARGREVMRMFATNHLQSKVYALTVTQDGTPGHPLYTGYDVMPTRLELPYCCECGCEIAPGNGLCGECACEDDCAP